ncbi:hypothetical protein H2201_006496 [Coniosporium apollinis]|uniref:PH domain-containing protein n=1 Tax=Coniosporium apollinis TaxID=61459 RepID=A0ABQ9NLR0_9PEZI|nr:hypothetical protein H2201_006496 [Coniosporium apollinis]
MSAEIQPSVSTQQPQQLDLPDLGPNSYTALRLQHATPEHLYLTTRRCFIGPIPEGWLKSHRREWYRHHLHINYSSRTASFSAAHASRQRRLTGLEGPSASAVYGRSFPQPRELRAEEETEGSYETANQDEAAPLSSGITVPRASNPDNQILEDGAASGLPNSSTQHPKGRKASNSGSQPDSKSRSKSAKGPGRARRKSTSDSYVTARESLPREVSPTRIQEDDNGQADTAIQATLSVEEGGPSAAASTQPRTSTAENSFAMPSGGLGFPSGPDRSTSMLIPNDDQTPKQTSEPQDEPSGTKKLLSKITRSPKPSDTKADVAANDAATAPSPNQARGLVRFNEPEGTVHAELQAKARLTQMRARRASAKIRGRSQTRDGQITKMEKMLVRMDTTMTQVPDDYDENDSQKIEYRTNEKWREYMVVCRESADEDAEFTLQMYDTRVIPEIERIQSDKKRSKHELPLSRKLTGVNLFSSLDKTIVVWVPWRKGTAIYIMQPHSAASAVEWYTFLRNILGWHRASELQVNIPDLSVSLRLDNPFAQLEASRDMAQAAEGNEEAIEKTMREEEAVAGNIIKRSIEMLEKSKDWHDIIGAWAKNERIGLVWKRYDRLEWIHGANERKMYGTIAMQKSHELELRPKSHYPTKTRDLKGQALIEPPPVEGFLVRLTSQKGDSQRLGRLFFKRLYFSTHNQYLVFSKPGKATPPPPPDMPMTENSQVPTAHQISEGIPIIYAVNPYPVEDGQISWLKEGHSESLEDQRHHDQDAYDEAQRKAEILLNCDGYVNLCNIVKVRHVFRGATPADQNVDEGDEVDFDAEVPDSNRDDGTIKEFDDHRTFELVMRNGLVIRLQAYDEETKKEWKKRLRDLIKYWKHRTVADIQLFKSVRRRNLEELGIDEETEAYVGQFARKWEVTKSHASPELYHMCGISCCRTIHMSGILYRKPRRHSTFTRCSVILSSGRLLVFQDSLRTVTGKEILHIHHERIASLDLTDCYLYSGFLTESDLLYQNRTFDSNKPGHTALPRIYLEDGWTSTDEDVMTCFVVWHGRRRSLFRRGDASGSGSEGVEGEGRRSRFRFVSSLGVPGRSIVFKARSRAERDHWVLAIRTEIERLQQAEEVRLTDGGEK